jgi:hypothetical protein
MSTSKKSNSTVIEDEDEYNKLKQQEKNMKKVKEEIMQAEENVLLHQYSKEKPKSK